MRVVCTLWGLTLRSIFWFVQREALVSTNGGTGIHFICIYYHNLYLPVRPQNDIEMRQGVFESLAPTIDKPPLYTIFRDKSRDDEKQPNMVPLVFQLFDISQGVDLIADCVCRISAGSDSISLHHNRLTKSREWVSFCPTVWSNTFCM